VSSGAKDGQVWFPVQDTGKGMSEDVQEKIFHPFYTTKDKGTGLGLAVINKIVTDHHGHHTVDSLAGSAVTFTVRLPEKALMLRKRLPPNEIPPPEHQTPPGTRPHRHIAVLVVAITSWKSTWCIGAASRYGSLLAFASNINTFSCCVHLSHFSPSVQAFLERRRKASAPASGPLVLVLHYLDLMPSLFSLYGLATDLQR